MALSRMRVATSDSPGIAWEYWSRIPIKSIIHTRIILCIGRIHLSGIFYAILAMGQEIILRIEGDLHFTDGDYCVLADPESYLRISDSGDRRLLTFTK